MKKQVLREKLKQERNEQCVIYKDNLDTKQVFIVPLKRKKSFIKLLFRRKNK